MKKLTAFATTVIMTSSVAFAGDVLSPGSDEFVDKGKVGAWQVYGDTERGTCLIEAVGANGNVVQMGLTDQSGIGYVGVFTKDDIGMVDGAKKEMIIVVDDQVYKGPATEMKRRLEDGYQGGYVLVGNNSFLDALKKGAGLIAWPDSNNGAGVAVDLTGSYKAIEAAIECNKSMGAS